MIKKGSVCLCMTLCGAVRNQLHASKGQLIAVDEMTATRLNGVVLTVVAMFSSHEKVCDAISTNLKVEKVYEQIATKGSNQQAREIARKKLTECVTHRKYMETL